jgi:hypothetical protein
MGCLLSAPSTLTIYPLPTFTGFLGKPFTRGSNGAGKSTLIGSIFAALFRQPPGQKRSLYDFATHPQPEIDLTFSVNGARYRSLLKIDPKSRQMVSYLFNGDGKPLTNGKKEPFEELLGKCAGTLEFFLSSIFSSQKRTGNFLSLGSGASHGWRDSRQPRVRQWWLARPHCRRWQSSNPRPTLWPGRREGRGPQVPGGF